MSSNGTTRFIGIVFISASICVGGCAQKTSSRSAASETPGAQSERGAVAADKYDRRKIWGRLGYAAELAHRSSRSAEAMELLKQATRVAEREQAPIGDRISLYEELASCSIFLDKKEKGRAALRQAVEAARKAEDGPRLEYVLLQLASLDSDSGKYKAACQSIDEVIRNIRQREGEESDSLIPIYLVQGKLRMEMGDKKNAEDSFLQVLNLYSTHPGFRKFDVAMANWYLSKISKENGKIDDARECIDRAVEHGDSGSVDETSLEEMRREMESLGNSK